jgi:hypothetical protein
MALFAAISVMVLTLVLIVYAVFTYKTIMRLHREITSLQLRLIDKQKDYPALLKEFNFFIKEFTGLCLQINTHFKNRSPAGN